jgi:hypothetical protein
MKKIIISVFLISFISGVTYFAVRVKSRIKAVRDYEEIVTIEYALCKYINNFNNGDFSITNFISYMNSSYPNIYSECTNVFDRNGVAVKICIKDCTNKFFFCVSSCGKDGVWKTKDDIVRDGYLLKEHREINDL